VQPDRSHQLVVGEKQFLQVAEIAERSRIGRRGRCRRDKGFQLTRLPSAAGSGRQLVAGQPQAFEFTEVAQDGRIEPLSPLPRDAGTSDG